MSSSNLTYKDYSFAHHGEVYNILEDVFSRNGIKYYLIGASARDVQLYKVGVKPTRGTADIDFAVMVPDFDIYNSLFDQLCRRGFRKTNEDYRLIYEKTNTVIDLMPYGKIEQDYTINFTQRDITLFVLGFLEVGNHVENIEIEEIGISLPTSPVVGLIILKLVSWKEKPNRTKDLDDISLLIRMGWEFYEEEAYKDHLDLFDDEDFDITRAAARIIGRKMKLMLASNETLRRIILSILNKALREKSKAGNPEIILAQKMDKPLEEVKRILTEIHQGATENW